MWLGCHQPQASKPYRLLSEAEREYAARAGSNNAMGNRLGPLQGNVLDWTEDCWNAATLATHRGNRAANIARARQLLGAAPRIVEHEEQKAAASDEPRVLPCPCFRCDGRMIVIEVFARGCEPTYRPTPIRITSARVN